MSAFIVGNDHIDALLTFAIDRRASYYVAETETRVYFDIQKATEIGRILMTENERSIRHRYDDDAVEDMAAGETAENYKYRRWSAPLTAVSILKGCSCFDYQACETDDYEKSLAAQIIDAIRREAIRSLPGYDDAPGWEFHRAKNKEKA